MNSYQSNTELLPSPAYDPSPDPSSHSESSDEHKSTVFVKTSKLIQYVNSMRQSSQDHPEMKQIFEDYKQLGNVDLREYQKGQLPVEIFKSSEELEKIIAIFFTRMYEINSQKLLELFRSFEEYGKCILFWWYKKPPTKTNSAPSDRCYVTLSDGVKDFKIIDDYEADQKKLGLLVEEEKRLSQLKLAIHNDLIEANKKRNHAKKTKSNLDEAKQSIATLTEKKKKNKSELFSLNNERIQLERRLNTNKKSYLIAKSAHFLETNVTDSFNQCFKKEHKSIFKWYPKNKSAVGNQLLNSDKQNERYCAEITMLLAIANTLYNEPGAVTLAFCAISIFSNNEQKFNLKPGSKILLELEGYKIVLIPPCQRCQSTKFDMFRIWRSFQMAGSQKIATLQADTKEIDSELWEKLKELYHYTSTQGDQLFDSPSDNFTSPAMSS